MQPYFDPTRKTTSPKKSKTTLKKITERNTRLPCFTNFFTNFNLRSIEFEPS
jgi:hypothetical protein